MAYSAIILKASVRKHPNADRLKLLDLNGYQVVTGADIQEGQLVCFFPEGGALSHEFVFENSEYRSGHGENKNPEEQGLFESNRRVKTIKLRGEKSEGYCVPLENLHYTGIKPSELVEGFAFTTLNGHEVCGKYISPATRDAQARAARSGRTFVEIEGFEKHFDTEQLRNFINRIPVGAVLYFTEKLHGTSGRTGHMFVPVSRDKVLFWKRAWCWLAATIWNLLRVDTDRIMPTFWLGDWKIITGSRNMTFEPGSDYADKYRKEVENLMTSTLQKGETVYYEIVGYTDTGSALFKHPVGGDSKDEVRKNLAKTYGPTMVYSYGCAPDNARPFDVYVYRITMNNENKQVEYSWPQVQRRAKEMGLKVVPSLGAVIYDGDKNKLLETLSNLSTGASTLDSKHIREGVCIRVEHPTIPVERSILKYKGFEFCHLEGIAKNETYVDPEEIA